MPRSFVVGLLVLATVSASSARAKVVHQSLREITDASDLVVIGRVIEMVPAGDTLLARVVVERALKGAPPPHVDVIAQRDAKEACDVSWSALGHRAVYFLKRADAPNGGADPTFHIGFGGRGRFELLSDDVVRLPSDVVLFPRDLPVQHIPNEFAATAQLADLARHIDACVAMDHALRGACEASENTSINARGSRTWRAGAQRALRQRGSTTTPVR